SMPEGYTRLYSTNPEMAEIIARSVTIPPPDFAALDQKLRALIAENRPFEAYLTASELALMLSAADFQKHIGILTPGLKAGSLFEAGTVSAITRHPGSEKDLETFIQILDNAKEKAGEKAYLLDLFKANHTRNVLGRKSDLTEADEQKLAEARQLIIGALRANPRLVGAHIDLGSSHFQSFDIMEAFLLWDHAERLAPAHDSLANILRMKSEAERDFPE